MFKHPIFRRQGPFVIRLFPLLLSFCAGLLLCNPAWSSSRGIAAIVDGDVLLIREATKYKLDEGVTLSRDDLVETSEQARLVRIELHDGSMFDLGPATRVMIAPSLPSSRTRATPLIYLLQGWVKWTAGKTTGALVSAPIDVQGLSNSLVISVQDNDSFAFAEAGEWTLIERRGVKSVTATTSTLQREQFYVREGDAKGKLLDRPTPDFLKRVPRAFLDTLPARKERFTQMPAVAPKRLGEIAYDDVQPWLNAEPALRRLFIPRWRAKAAEPDFQKALLADMASHPEWDPVLHPEKFQPRGPSPKARLGNPGLTLQ